MWACGAEREGSINTGQASSVWCSGLGLVMILISLDVFVIFIVLNTIYSQRTSSLLSHQSQISQRTSSGLTFQMFILNHISTNIRPSSELKKRNTVVKVGRCQHHCLSRFVYFSNWWVRPCHRNGPSCLSLWSTTLPAQTFLVLSAETKWGC